MLTTPVRIGPVQLRHRVVMGSMHTGFEERPGGHRRLAALYAERVRGGADLVVTGGLAPDARGRLHPLAATLTHHRQLHGHRRVTDAVHAEGGHVLLQLLHAGRYAFHPLAVSASRRKAPIAPFAPWRLTHRGVVRAVESFARAAGLAREAGYDGVEVMGSEGYLVNQFLAPATNDRDDAWGGSPAARRRFALAVVSRVREALGPDAVLSYRISLADLVADGQTWDEVVTLARGVEAAGADLLNSGVGWHESRVPTIVTSVPRAAFADLTGRLRPHVGVPVVASNRISTPADAEAVLARGDADLVSMARPFLADPEWVAKAASDRADEINVCIGCNQACLDRTFALRSVSCLVNPRAGRETTLTLTPVRRPRPVAVVGAGPAGLAAAAGLADRGHQVTLYEARDHLGGQFDLARRIPGKEEFAETIRYFTGRLERAGVEVRLATSPGAAELAGFADVVVATGVRPRRPAIPGIEHPSVLTYDEALRDPGRLGARVAVIGAGGVGVDVATFLTQHPAPDLAAWRAEWGVAADGGLVAAAPAPPARQVHLVQRKRTRVGADLGTTTGWVHRATLRAKDVETVTGAQYERIDDDGLHLRVGDRPRLLAVDTVVVCAGQEPVRDLVDELAGRSVRTHVIGGADVAAELDAERAIRQGTELAARLGGRRG
nr:NADPH-dependent 2,4-dienoyl-CoA reductase [Actinomycetospora corticicola]